MYYVNVYEVDRGYGGPEEGGWWYNIGIAKDSVKCFTRKGAMRKRRSLYGRWNENGGLPVHSVNYKGGEFIVCVEKEKAQDYPIERPRYE
jgi:hypothetical protein